jgi:hypothetical protein
MYPRHVNETHTAITRWNAIGSCWSTEKRGVSLTENRIGDCMTSLFMALDSRPTKEGRPIPLWRVGNTSKLLRRGNPVSLRFLLLGFLPFLKVVVTLRAVPAQLLAVYAQVELFPSWTSEHQAAEQIAATAAGWYYLHVNRQLHGAEKDWLLPHAVVECHMALTHHGEFSYHVLR